MLLTSCRSGLCRGKPKRVVANYICGQHVDEQNHLVRLQDLIPEEIGKWNAFAEAATPIRGENYCAHK